MMDSGCFSHTIDHVGEKTSWIGIFSRSPKASYYGEVKVGGGASLSLSKGSNNNIIHTIL